MPSIEDIIRDVSALPAEERAMVIDSLLRTLNPPDPEIDKAWVEVAKRRLLELRSGSVKPVPGEEVLSRVKAHFTR